MKPTVSNDNGNSYDAVRLCLTLSEVGNSFRDGLNAQVFLRDLHGRTLLTHEDSYNAFRALKRGAAREVTKALQPLVRIARAYRAGLLTMPAEEVVVQNDKRLPLLKLSDGLQAEELLAA